MYCVIKKKERDCVVSNGEYRIAWQGLSFLLLLLLLLLPPSSSFFSSKFL
jgi:hypothetical protein